MKESKSARISLIVSMVVFGTIGIFRRYIDMPSGVIAMMRGLIGAAFLLLLMRARGQKLSMAGLKRYALLLGLSGAAMGFNWILLFEAYRYTTVATATLCYYMAPIFVMIASPVLLGERLTGRKIACVAAALAGMVLVSGVLDVGLDAGREMRGVLLGLGAAALYASVILLNKRIADIPANDRTVVQLGAAAVVLLPYTLMTGELAATSVTAVSAAMLLVVGVVHTGVTYALYFGSIRALPAQTVALMSYIDPVVAILLSALLLGEAMTPAGAVGAALVLGAALISEMPGRKGRAA